MIQLHTHTHTHTQGDFLKYSICIEKLNFVKYVKIIYNKYDVIKNRIKPVLGYG